MRAGISRYRQAYQEQEPAENQRFREDVVLRYTPLVKQIAERMAIRLPPSISREELISAGIIGLFDALDKFDAEMGIKFETYAEHRIRGAILDELRKMDWIPRSVRKDIHRIENAMAEIQSRVGRAPEDFEIASELGIDMDSYYRMLTRAQGVSLLSLDEFSDERPGSKLAQRASNVPSPFDELKVKEVKKVVAEAIRDLPKREQLVISLYYYEELTLKEIAAVLGVTESRVSQIHSKAIMMLRTKLRAYYRD